MFAAGAPRALSRRLGAPAIIDALGADGARERAAVEHSLGFDPLSLDAWVESGVDVDRPVGGALLSIAPPALAIGFAIADREKLRRAFSWRSPGVEVDERVEGALTLWSAEDMTLALHGDEAWLIVGEGLMPGESLFFFFSL